MLLLFTRQRSQTKQRLFYFILFLDTVNLDFDILQMQNNWIKAMLNLNVSNCI